MCDETNQVSRAQVTKHGLYYHGSLFCLLHLCINISRGIQKLTESECWKCEASMTSPGFNCKNHRIWSLCVCSPAFVHQNQVRHPETGQRKSSTYNETHQVSLYNTDHRILFLFTCLISCIGASISAEASRTKHGLYYHGSLFSLLHLCINISRGIQKLTESECWTCKASMID